MIEIISGDPTPEELAALLAALLVASSGAAARPTGGDRLRPSTRWRGSPNGAHTWRHGADAARRGARRCDGAVRDVTRALS
ncbi:MAG: acyl-CoA carboxylase subunit epsilon [Actinobacteria bacterium]|nr:acyl-CoA carboxylase subunit epsilon [Actinomycetota bacterium]